MILVFMQTHTHTHTAAQLIFFNAEAQRDGRSVLLTWELEFTGGPPVVDLQFIITVCVCVCAQMNMCIYGITYVREQ